LFTFCVVTGLENAEGFRLAGIDAAVANSPGEALEKIEIVLAGRGCGLLLVDDDLYEGIDEGYRRRFERAGLPVIVPLPMERAWGTEDQSMDYLLRLIRRSIGYHMRLKK
jgi:vacuolar-type H+-ATPase subunit F/Vma7